MTRVKEGELKEGREVDDVHFWLASSHHRPYQSKDRFNDKVKGSRFLGSQYSILYYICLQLDRNKEYIYQ